MRKKLIGASIFLIVALAASGSAYAATSNYQMTYLAGTSDTVTNLPSADMGEGGSAYAVSDAVPQREGYEFIDWTLDYDLFNTYTLTYQVVGDPTHGKPADITEPTAVTDIREGSSVTLAAGLTAPEEYSDSESYTVDYKEVGTDRMLRSQKIVPGNQAGDVVYEDAIDIAGYVVVGDTSQSLTIEHGVVGSWEFTGWCSDEACTMPITEVTNISADTTVYGKWVYSETTNSNEIVFYYMHEQYTSYIVRYIDRTTGGDIAAPKTVEGQRVGDIVTEEAVESDSHDLADEASKQLRLSEKGNEIFFYYVPAVANYTVRYVDITDGGWVDIIEPENGTGNVGSSVTKTRKSFYGYMLSSPTRITKTLSRDETANEFVFTYIRVN